MKMRGYQAKREMMKREQAADGTLAEFPKCSCRKSTCILLYCACFGEGKPCESSCKCVDCKNTHGANPTSKTSTAAKNKLKEKESKARQKKAKKQKAAADDDAANNAQLSKPFPSLLMLTVSPGRLGLTLSIVPDGGAKVMHIDPACTFRGQICVGDRIVTIDGQRITKLEDVAIGKERVRKFGIVKAPPHLADAGNGGGDLARSVTAFSPKAQGTTAAAAASMSGSKKKVSNYVSALGAMEGRMYTDPLNPPEPLALPPRDRKQTFPYLRELGAADEEDRLSEVKREVILTELLQWDKKHGVNVSTV